MSSLILIHFRIFCLVVEFTRFKIYSIFFTESEGYAILLKTDLSIDQSLLSSSLHLQQIQVLG